MGSELLDEFETVLSAGIEYYLICAERLTTDEEFESWMKVKESFKTKLLDMEQTIKLIEEQRG